LGNIEEQDRVSSYSRPAVPGRSKLAHLHERFGKVNFRLSKSNVTKLEKVAEELPYFALPPYLKKKATKQRILIHILNQFLKRHEEDPAGFRELIESRRHGVKICVHLDLRLRYALWRAKKIFKISQNQLVNLAIESYVLKENPPESQQEMKK